MNYRNVLSSHQKKDGTYAVRLYVYNDHSKRYLPTGFSVKGSDWNEKKGMVKSSHPMASHYNRHLAAHRNEVELYLLNGGRIEDYGKRKSGGSIIEFLEQYIDSNHGLKERTVKSYRTTLLRLRQFCADTRRQDLNWANITQPVYNEFCQWVLNNGAGKPGLGKHIRIIKKMMRLGKEQGLHENTGYQEKWFKTHQQSRTHKIYLTEDEMARIEQLNLSDMPGLERERDRFLVAFYFLMRFCDVVVTSKEQFFFRETRKYIHYKSMKTGIEATLPVKSAAWSLLEKYNFDLSFSTNQHANRELKRIASMAGINQIVTQGDRSGPKSQFVTFHTARRSAATILRLQGASLKTIADLGGWRKLGTVEIYLRASGMDSALLAEKLGFFE